MSTGRCAEDFERRKIAWADCTIAQTVGEFTRHLSLEPGYDHRAFPDDCGGGGHGQHGMNLRMVLVGAEGAVQWLAYLTALVPGRADGNFGTVKIEHPSIGAAMAADLGYHWPTPRYEGQETYGTQACEWLPGGRCYYDGSGLNAEPLLVRFLAEGPYGVWQSLEDYYRDIAGQEK